MFPNMMSLGHDIFSIASTHKTRHGYHFMLFDLLGNVVISKKFLRTRKIMVMHSNERGECCLRTLIDRSGSVDAT